MIDMCPAYIRHFISNNYGTLTLSKQDLKNILLSYSTNYPEYSNLQDLCLTNRPDLRYNFERFDSNSPILLNEWLNNFGLRELNLDAIISNIEFSERIQESMKYNIIGIENLNSGIGTSALNFVSMLQHKDKLNTFVTLDLSKKDFVTDIQLKGYQKPIRLTSKNIFFINSDLMRAASHRFTKTNFRKCYKIGYWAWEMEDINPIWKDGLNFVDEIWCSSKFVKNALKKITSKDVFVKPIPIFHDDYQSLEYRDKTRFQPQTYFLFVFDFLSCMERKNVLNLVRVFKDLHESNKYVKNLVIKVSNSKYAQKEMQKLRDEIGNSKKIEILEDSMTKHQLLDLMSNAFFYVSIHRSEGFGLTIAESMSMGTPVICTNYSGNTEFANDTNSVLIDYKIVQPGASAADIYKFDGAFWAEPDLDMLRECLIYVCSNESVRVKLSARAKSDVRLQFHPEKIYKLI